MAEKTNFENGHISNLEGLVTLTLDRAILHTVVQHSSTSNYMPISLKLKKLCRRMYVRTDGHLRPALLGK